MKVFGSKSVCLSLKLTFFESLVISRLLYNTQLWVIGSTSSHTAVRRLNTVYMQVARRIADCARYGQERCDTDLGVRRKLSIVSIECRMRQMRLLYLGRLVRFGPEPLLALLSTRGNDKDHSLMPWTAQIVNDLCIFHEFHSWSLSELPCPRVGATAWYTMMSNFPHAWKELVSNYRVFCSVFDPDKKDHTSSLVSGPTHVCPHGCEGAFLSEKALGQHMRRKHKIQSHIPYYIDGSGICLACGVNLFARATVITHACEMRYTGKTCRVSCRDVILGGAVPKLPSEIFLRLQERDRNLVAAARKAGHSHVRAVCSAKRVASAAANRYITASMKDTYEFVPNDTYNIRLP